MANDRPVWAPLPRSETPRLDALEALPDAMRAAQARVTWDDFSALLQARIPARDLLAPGGFAFGVVRLKGRRMIATDSPRLRAYLTGVGLFEMPNN